MPRSKRKYSKLPLIIKCRYITPDTTKKVGGKDVNVYEFYANGKDYEEYLNNKSKHEGKSENEKFTYEKYQQREGKNANLQKHCESFNELGEVNRFNPANTRAKAGTTVWDVLISLNPQVSVKNDLSANALQFVKITYLNLLIANKRNGWTDKNTDWIATVHKDKAHHHIHMKIYQPEKINLNEIITKNKVSLSFMGPAIVQISRNLYGLKQNSEQVSKSRDELRQEFDNYLASIINGGVGDALREQALESTKLHDIKQLSEQLDVKFKQYGMQLNYGNLKKPIQQKVFYYQKLDPTKYENNLNSYSKDNQKLLKTMFKHVTHVQTTHAWALMQCKPDEKAVPLFVYAPVYADQLEMNSRERIEWNEKYIKQHGINKFKEFTKQREIDHFEKTKVYDVRQVVKLESRNKSDSILLPEQVELKQLIDNYIKDVFIKNVSLNDKNKRYEKDVENYFDLVQKSLDPENVTKFVAKTIDSQKLHRINEMQIWLGNRVLKSSITKGTIEKHNVHSPHHVAHMCKDVTKDLHKYLNKAFKEYFVQHSARISAHIDNEVKGVLHKEMIEKQKEEARLLGYEYDEESQSG